MSEAAEQAADGGRAGVTPARLLAEMRAIGDRTRAAARGYWLPLLLFGLLICGSLPFYQRLPSPRSLPGGRPGSGARPGHCRLVPGHPCHLTVAGQHVTVIFGPVHETVVTALGYYWQAAIPAGIVLTVAWYRWRGNRLGLRPSTSGFLIAGLVLAELVLLVPLLIAAQPGPQGSLAREVDQAGALVLIAAVLWVLAWTERSWPLAIVVAVFFVVTLPVSHYDGGGVGGGGTGAADLSLDGLRLLGLIPGLVLLVAGAVAWLAGRLRGARAARAGR
jgi:hypothetical protein